MPFKSREFKPEPIKRTFVSKLQILLSYINQINGSDTNKSTDSKVLKEFYQLQLQKLLEKHSYELVENGKIEVKFQADDLFIEGVIEKIELPNVRNVLNEKGIDYINETLLYIDPNTIKTYVLAKDTEVIVDNLGSNGYSMSNLIDLHIQQFKKPVIDEFSGLICSFGLIRI
jgi:hypothetical protein